MHHAPPQIVVFYVPSAVITRQTVRGILRYANTFGPWNVSLQDADAPTTLPKDCSGVIICTPNAPLLKALQPFTVPTVLIAFETLVGPTLSAARKLPSVRVDSRDFGVKAAEFFLAHAARTFAYVDWRTRAVWSRERGEAFVRRLRKDGKEVHLYPARRTPLSPADDADRLQAWLKELPKPVSIFAANDARARDVLNACLSANIAVPYEAAILGADNDEWICEETRPRLSSIPFRSEEVGYAAAKMLDAHLQAADQKSAPPPFLEKLAPGEIVLRESTDERIVTDPIVGRALAFIKVKRGLNIRASDVARELGLTTNWIETHFRQSQGTSLSEEITRVRLATVLNLIQETDTPFQEISRLCGFTRATTLCHFIKRETGKSMRDLRKGR